MIFLSPCRFQSTFPRGERHLCWLVAVKHIHFNPRSLVGNDYIPVGTYTIVEISIHVPSWGTTIFTRRQPPCILFQSTFPRGERRHRYQILRTKNRFQSTFPRGERRTGGSQAVAACNFNPRSLVGNDALHFHRDWRRFISIHVPSWGTTGDFARTSGSWAFQSTFPRGERLARLGKFGWTALFQSTFPRGERLQYMASDNEDVPFQSTFPRGERRSLWIVIRLVFDDFNPRSLVGNDQEFEITQSRIVISIHVPSWGTTDRSSPETATTTFQSTFPRGERQFYTESFGNVVPISIHVPSWGTTSFSRLNLDSQRISIHVPSWGTTKILQHTIELFRISIHVPSWGTTRFSSQS